MFQAQIEQRLREVSLPQSKKDLFAVFQTADTAVVEAAIGALVLTGELWLSGSMTDPATTMVNRGV